MYSTGLATRPASMLASSQSDSFSRLRVLSANRSRQSSPIAGTVRRHRSARPASTGFSGSGVGVAGSAGMNSGSRSRCALPASRSLVRLYMSRKWSSKKKTQTYQSVTSDSTSAEASGWV